LVEGIADATGGRADFVASGEDLSLKVIPQLELSLLPSITGVNIHIEGHDSIEISPFPIGNITPNISSTFFVRSSSPFSPSQSVLVTGQYIDESTDTVVETRPAELELIPLFAFESLRCLERDIKLGRGNLDELRSRAVTLSVESGVLCSETAFVGFSEKIYRVNACEARCCSARHYGCCGFKAKACGAPMRLGAVPAPPPQARCYAAPPPGMVCYEGVSLSRGMRAPVPVAAVFKFRDVTDRQEIDGSWKNATLLLDRVGGAIQVFPELDGVDRADEIFATIVALAILRAKCMENAAAWRMIEGKAVRWLKARGVDFEPLIARAVAGLSK
jgi:hypothetical protein